MPAPAQVFEVAQIDHTLVVTPIATQSSCRYQDVHLESNRILKMLADQRIHYLVIDLGRIDRAGALMIGAMVRMEREMLDHGGKTAFCCVSRQMQNALCRTSVLRLWTCCEARDEAVEFVSRENSATNP